jgi:hypothetical protein
MILTFRILSLQNWTQEASIKFGIKSSSRLDLIFYLYPSNVILSFVMLKFDFYNLQSIW